MSTTTSSTGRPPSPTLDELYAQRAALDAKIANKLKKSEKDFSPYGESFVREVGEETLRKIPLVASLEVFTRDANMRMARGVQPDDEAPFLAARIELLTRENDPLCCVIVFLFQSFFDGKEAQYTTAGLAQGDNGFYYPSPIRDNSGNGNCGTILRRLVAGQKFIADLDPYKKGEDGSYSSANRQPSAHYFRLKQV